MPALTGIFCIFLASFEAMLRMLCLCWTQLGVKLSPKIPNLRSFGRDLDFHLHHLASSWGSSGDHLAPTLAEVGPSWGRLGAAGPRANLPILGTQCDTLYVFVSGPSCACEAQLAFKPAQPTGSVRGTAKFDPRRLLGGPSRSTSFLSGWGRFLSRRESNKPLLNEYPRNITTLVFVDQPGGC